MPRFSTAAILFALSGVASAAEGDVYNPSSPNCPGGDLAKCTAIATCKNYTVIHDQASGWLDDCEGLTEAPGNHTEAQCKKTCYDDINCAVWQYSNYEDGVLKAPNTFCYTGVPEKDCDSRTTPVGFKTLAGQRIQKGKAHVTGSALAQEVMGLKQFDMKTGTDAEQQIRCRDHCYSDVKCGVWQYEIFEGAKSCWVEKDTARTGVTKNNTFSKRVSGGEFITHYCPTPNPPKEDGLPWPWIIAGIIAGLLALGAILYLLRPQPKVKKTRAVKIAAKPEPAPAPAVPMPVFVPQPSMLLPVQQPIQMQTIPVMQAQTIQMQAPVQYSVVPQQSYVSQPMMTTVSTPFLR